MYELRLKIQWSLFLRVKLTIFQHRFRQWLRAVQATSHDLNQCWLVYRRISASLGRNELNSLRPRLNRCPFVDDIFKCIFLDENKLILIRISLKFVPEVRINDILALVQIMAWCQSGDKSLSEPMMVRLSTHICVTRPQWVKYFMKHTTKTHNTPKGMALQNRILYLFYFIERLKAIESWDKTPTGLTLRNV